MALNSVQNERNEMLSPSSTPKEMLRALYFHGVDHLILNLNRRELLLHKDQLIALLEHGGENSTISELASHSAGEQMSARGQIEEVPQNTSLLVFSQIRKDAGGPRFELAKITFREYRERRIRENTIVLPEWWSIPLPILHVTEDAIFLNDKALGLVPGGAVSLASQMDRIREDRIVTLNGDEGDRTFSLYALTDDSYLIEDISGDFEMAEDLVWWAAVGRALVRRMENEGVTVKRLSAYEKPPEGAAEVIQCLWDGEIIGSLAVDLTGDGLAEAHLEAVSRQEYCYSKGDTLDMEEGLESHAESACERPAEPPSSDIRGPQGLSAETGAEPDAEASKEGGPEVQPQGDRDFGARPKDKDAETLPDDPAGRHELSMAEGSSPAPEHGGTSDSIRKNEARTAYGGKKHKYNGRNSGMQAKAAGGNDTDRHAKKQEDSRTKTDAPNGPVKNAEFPVITPVRMRRLDNDPHDKGKYHDDGWEEPGGAAKTGKDNQRGTVSEGRPGAA
jgi:hypothetical protein